MPLNHVSNNPLIRKSSEFREQLYFLFLFAAQENDDGTDDKDIAKLLKKNEVSIDDDVMMNEPDIEDNELYGEATIMPRVFIRRRRWHRS